MILKRSSPNLLFWGENMREAVYSRYDYPNWKSRLKTYFLKVTTLIHGEVWKKICHIQIGEDETWRYTIEIMEAEWCKVREIIILRELKTMSSH